MMEKHKKLINWCSEQLELHKTFLKYQDFDKAMVIIDRMDGAKSAFNALGDHKMANIIEIAYLDMVKLQYSEFSNANGL
jgi:hypothetical protein